MPAYPGLGLPIRHNAWGAVTYPHGADNEGISGGTESELLYIRELAMMDIMEKLTDKPGWYEKILDDEIAAKWRQEALDIPDKELYNFTNGGGEKRPTNVLSENAVDCCIKELRSKAKYFEKTGIIPTLEACASVAKSDTLVSRELHEALRSAFDKLKVDQQGAPDWHPNSSDMVQDLVHPSMYPLVYGRSRAFEEECVGVDDAIKLWAGKGTVIPVEPKVVEEGRYRWGLDHYSNDYQWLPANATFQADGSVKFTSYINNLHPTKYPELYRTIEKLVETALPLWDQCLGYQHAEVDQEDLIDEGYDPEFDDEEDKATFKWKIVRQPRLPEPEFKDIDYAPKPGKRLFDRYKESGLQIIVKMASIELTPSKPAFPAGSWHLEGQLNEHICGTALYYLDSDNIEDNHLSFRMPTPSDIGYDSKYAVGQQSFSWMEAVFGTELSGGSDSCLQNYGSVLTRQGRLLAFPNTLQHKVSSFGLIDPTKPGHRRFIALWLVDPGKRIISTANVPPQQLSWYADNLLGNNITTRKQALDKLPAELVTILQERGVVSSDGITGENAKLPIELMDMVREYVDADGHALPMGLEEAKEHRLKLMAERSKHANDSEQEWDNRTYNFCEH
ncbi:hypothetical protein IQ06DRAFT_311930 [Phaeosphaeriaceae sp. SRC1lsM3a]|nr:hypothetical protein IQ06DRAFT_311930 [Stagonospora sp. SRC1lsM3a]